LVDLHKASGNFPHNLELDTELQGLVVAFYRQNFWIYDEIEDQAIANKLFDLAVNVGKVHSNKIVQKCVQVDPDGFLGPQTILAINATCSGSLLPAIKTEAAEYYKDIVKSHPQDAIFLKGWLARLNS
jgi:lysozyme family protein